MKDICRIIRSWDGEKLCNCGKKTVYKHTLGRRIIAGRAAGAVAVLLSVVTVLSSCSVIKINYDRFSPKDTDGAETSAADSTPVTEPSGGTEPEEEEPFVPPAAHVYGGRDEAEAMLATVDYDFGGKSVFIRSTDEAGIGRLCSFSEEDTDAYSVARYERFRMIEDSLGCRINHSVTTLPEMAADIRAAVSDGGYYADLLAVPSADMTYLAKEGLLLSLYSLPFFELDAPYFGTMTSDLAAGNDAYASVSFATVDPDAVPCVFYDSAKITKNVESEVRAGTWTWDEMTALADGAGGKISVDGGAGDGGVARICELAAASAGLKFVMNRRGEAPAAVMPEGFDDVLAVCRRVLADGRVFESTAADAFAAGSAVFAFGRLGDMNALAGSPVAWGVLPVPRTAPGGDGYRGLITEPSLVFAVPVSTTDAPGASALLRAFGAASYGFMCDAYEEYHLYNTVRFESSADMIGVVFGSAYYDLAHVFASAGEIAPATYMLLPEAVGGADAGALFQVRRWAANYALSGLFPIRG